MMEGGSGSDEKLKEETKDNPQPKNKSDVPLQKCDNAEEDNPVSTS
jgi:hypothetical protein